MEEARIRKNHEAKHNELVQIRLKISWDIYKVSLSL